ncbi:MAG: VanZ family protein [Lachnospiraceae bacterium]|nr:VanZ family protein [Lachnospiraceae bacterium]
MNYFHLFCVKLARYLLKPLSFLPAIVVMVAIFHFSSQTGPESSQLSYRVSHKIVTLTDRIADKGWSEEEIGAQTQRIHYYVRKGAHMTEYFILAACVAFPLYVYGIRGLKLIIFAGVFCVGFAATDEYHQSFVSGRGASPRDVAIDSIGIFPGILCTMLVGWIGRKTLFAPLSLEKHNREYAAWEEEQEKRKRRSRGRRS